MRTCVNVCMFVCCVYVCVCARVYGHVRRTMVRLNVYCLLRGLSRARPFPQMGRASRFQLTLCQRISRRRGMIVGGDPRRNIFGQYLCKTLGSPRRLLFLRDVGNMVIKIDPCFPSNLSKQLTCKQHDTLLRARGSERASFVSIAALYSLDSSPKFA